MNSLVSTTTSTRTNSDGYGEQDQDYKTTVKVWRSQADRLQEITGHQPVHEFLDELLELYKANRNLNGGR